MDRMPPEIKHLIAKNTRDASLESLRALSVVDQEGNRIASPLLYEHIVIRVLQEEVPHNLLWLPESNRVLVHIKRLSIVATWCPVDHSTPQKTLRAYRSLRVTLEDNYNLGDQSIPRLGACPRGHWAGVIGLIRKVPSLQDINLLISTGGSAELHEVIAQYHPACRLSIYFTPQSGDKYHKSRDWVLSSPQLHTAHVILFEYPRRRNFSEHPDRVLEDVVVRAPHIKRLTLQISAGGQIGPKPDFNETVPVERRSETMALRAKLEQLSWPLNTRLPAEQFFKWDQLIEYSCLRSWTAGCIEDTEVLGAITHLRPFQQLTRLTLALIPPDNNHNTKASFHAATEAMFDSLPPLTYLSLPGTYKLTLLTPALRKHGPTLRELHLNLNPADGNEQPLRRLRARGQTGPIILRAEEFQQTIAAHCPSLHTLRIAIQRHCGLETAAYTALAQLPELMTLHLLLACTPQVSPQEIITEFEREQAALSTGLDLPTWYIRDTMINSATDKDLATAIFTHIRAQQLGRRRLAKLTIHPLLSVPEGLAAAAAPRPTRALRPLTADIFKVLASPWTVEADTAAGVRAIRHVQERHDPDWLGLFGGQVQLEAIFDSLRPPVDGDGGRLQRWRSWPLQSG